MRFKVELIFVDQENMEKNISYSTFVEATDKDAAVAIAKKKQLEERPGLSPTDRWAWVTCETHERA